MDSFIHDHRLTEWPDKVGPYWFYGYRYGKEGAKPELMLCKVFKISNGLMVAAEGQIMNKSEVEEAKFIPATLPELPC